MNTFRDTAGRVWRLNLTPDAVLKLAAVGVDISTAGGLRTAVAPILADPDAFGRTVWTLVEVQATGRGVTPERFARRFDARTVRAAADALVAAVLLANLSGPAARREFAEYQAVGRQLTAGGK